MTLAGCSIQSDSAGALGHEVDPPAGEEGGLPPSSGDDGDEGGADDDGSREQPLEDLPDNSDAVGAECDPGKQDCPDGLKCTPYVSEPDGTWADKNHCVDISGSRALGDSCERVEGDDDCDIGLYCNAGCSSCTGPGTCEELCDVENEGSCSSGDTCTPWNEGALPLCTVACDPLAEECGDDQLCVPFPPPSQFGCAGKSENPDNPAGSECDLAGDCAAGAVCIPAEYTGGCGASEYCCAALCEYDTETCAGEGEICISWFEGETPAPGLEHVGVCIAP